MDKDSIASPSLHSPSLHSPSLYTTSLCSPSFDSNLSCSNAENNIPCSIDSRLTSPESTVFDNSSPSSNYSPDSGLVSPSSITENGFESLGDKRIIAPDTNKGISPSVKEGICAENNIYNKRTEGKLPPLKIRVPSSNNIEGNYTEPLTPKHTTPSKIHFSKFKLSTEGI